MLTVIPAGPSSEDNFFTWEALIKGPDDTPFEGGVFNAILTFPKDYPLNPPKVRCIHTLYPGTFLSLCVCADEIRAAHLPSQQ